MGEIANKKTNNERDLANVMNKVETHLKNIEKSGTIGGGLKYGIFGGKAKLVGTLRDFVSKGGKDSEAEQMKKIFEGVLKELKTFFSAAVNALKEIKN